jgi:cardiolipin synthase
MFLLAICSAAFIFVFNPFGLGPEPRQVLSPSFFSSPARDLGSLELLIDGEEAVERIAQVIDTAEKSVFLQIFIWKDDRIGRRTAEKLNALAEKGVQVTVNKDLLGTFFELGDMLKGKPSPVFTKAGLRGHDNITVNTHFFADNDHSKYVIVDSRAVAFGGMNIADEYHMDWHDYMVLMKNRQWTEAFEKRVLHAEPWPDDAPFMITVNDRKATEIRTAYVEMIDNAKEQVIVEHAYFSDDKVIEALQRAAHRGVKVKVVLPKEPDTHIFANMETINRLLSTPAREKIRIFLYPRMSHAKVAMTDGVIAAVGSANLTPRSMFTTREVTLFVHGTTDDRFISRLRTQLHADIAESQEVTEPFSLGIRDRVYAFAGKYVW